MYHNFSSMLAVLLVVIAGVTVLIMLEMNSKPHEDKDGKSGWFAMHRFLGYLFLVLFAVMLAGMVFSTGGLQMDMSLAGPSMPAVLVGLLLVPLIMIKAAIARRRSQISARLILLGTAIFGLAFGLTALTAKYYADGGQGFKYAFSNGGDKEIVSMEPGQSVMSRKCSKCHTLERIYTSAVSDWEPTVRRMAERDAPNISNADVGQIVAYLNQQQERRQLSSDAERGRKLVSSKCGICHGLDKVFAANLSEQRWRETVDDMVKIIGDPEYLSAQEREDIVGFLSSRRQSRKELWAGREGGQPDAPPSVDEVKKLVIKKCSAGCHALDRVLRPTKTREEWAETVSSMIEITGDPEFLSEEEKRQIIDFLIRQKQEQAKPDKDGEAARPKSSSADHPLVSSKCGRCHDLERVHQAEKTKEQWQETVSSMVENTGDANYLSEQEKQDIITIISSWEVVK